MIFTNTFSIFQQKAIQKEQEKYDKFTKLFDVSHLLKK